MSVREFNNPPTSYVNLLVGTGGLASLGAGAFTIGGIVKPLVIAQSGVFISFHNGPAISNPTNTIAALADDGGGSLALYNDTTAASASVGLSLNDWQFIAVTKASGTVAPRLHRKLLTGGSMTHVSSGVTMPNNATAINNIQIGALRGGAFGTAKPMRAAFFFAMAAVMSDADLETFIASLSSAAIVPFSPAGGWELNQASSSVAISDFTHQGANQLSLVGGVTVVEGDDPPSWAFGEPSPPSNTASPALTGTPVIPNTLTCSTGTWTGSPLPTYTYQWKRNTGSGYTNISGATSNTYALQLADENALVKCTVTGTNTGGTSSADSNAVTVLAPPPVDIEFRLSGGAANSDPAASHGGARSSVEAGSDLWDTISRAEANPGHSDYRLVYLYNNDTAGANVKVWISTQPTPATLAVGLATEAVDVAVSATADENTAPSGVTFSSPTTSGTALNVADLAAGQFKGLWIRRTVPAATAGSPIPLSWQLTREITAL
jgi:hypothetical protein